MQRSMHDGGQTKASRSRRWAAIARKGAWPSVLLLLAIGVIAVRVTIKLADRLHGVVEERFETVVGGRMRVGDVSWRWGYVDFVNVEADAPLFPGPAHIRRVRVHFSVTKAVHLDPVAAVDRIEVFEPTVSLGDSLVTRMERWRNRPASSSRPSLPEITATIADGSIVYDPGDGLDAVPLIEGLTGWVGVTDRIGVYITGNALSDAGNFSLTAAVSLTDDLVQVRGSASQMDLARARSDAFPTIGGIVDARVGWSDSLEASLRLDGVHLMRRDSIGIGPISTTVVLSGSEARWEPTDVAIEGVILSTRGLVRWGATPHVDVAASWRGTFLRVGRLLDPAVADLHGNIRGEMALRGPLKAPTLAVRLSSDSLATRGVHARDLLVHGYTDPIAGPAPNVLVIDTLVGNVHGTRIVGTGSGRLDPLDIRLALSARSLRLDSIPALAGVGLAGSANATADVSVSGVRTRAELRFDDVDVRLHGHELPIDSASLATGDSSGTIHVSAGGRSARLSGAVRVGDADSLSVALDVALAGYEPPIGRAPPRLSGALRLESTGTRLTATGDVVVARRGKQPFPLRVDVETGWLSGDEPFSARFATDALPFYHMTQSVSATVRRDTDGWRLSGTSWDGMVGISGRMPDGGNIVGAFTLRDVPLIELSRIVRLDRFLTSGKVSGQVNVAVLDGKVEGNGDIRLSDFTMKGVTSLTSAASVTIDGDSVTWMAGPFELEDRPLLFNSGTYRIPDGSVSSRIWGPPDGRLEMALALGGVALDAHGDALWSVKIEHEPRTEPATKLAIDVFATGGEIVRVPFDTTEVHLAGDSRWLGVSDALVHRVGFYRAVCTDGRIPAGAGPDAELDLPIRILPDSSNDVFWLLTHLIDKGVSGRGAGEGYVRIAGRPSQTVFGEGWFAVHDGELRWPTDVWPTWTDVDIRASIVPESRSLQIERFSADVATGEISITNAPAQGFGAEPFVVDAVGISLGVLGVETRSAIPLHVRGAMPDGEHVDVELTGRGVSDRFLIAGPWVNPVFVGDAIVSNGAFTYPLEDASGEVDTTEMSDLGRRINWRVDLVTGRNLTYESRQRSGSILERMLDDPLQLLGSMAAELEARLAEGGRAEMRGIYSGGGLSVATHGLISTQARISILDLDFAPDGPLVIEWDTRSDREPLIRGRGVTVLGDTARIYARLVSIDPVTNLVHEGGRFGELTVELDSDELRGNLTPQERQLAILQKLGYYSGEVRQGESEGLQQGAKLDPGELVSAGYRTLLRRSEQQAWRNFLRPVERQIRRLTNIDVLDIQPSVLLNLLDDELPAAQFSYLRGTKWTVGQYLWGRLLLSYHGQLEIISIARPALGARHQVAFEWAISPATRLEMTRDIDVPVGVPDTRLGLSHRFAFQSY